MSKTVYMDYAATTYTKPEVLDEMIPYFTQFYGNPSSIYSISRETKKALDLARDRVAKAINADRSEIYFTGGGSEADNWAIKGIAFAHKNKGNHIITTKIEHHAVLHACEYLEKNHGFEVTYLDVNEEGLINIEDLKNAITDKTILVTIMFANNEIGVIQSIKEIGQICRDKKVFFHTDAVQAVGNVPIDVKDMNIDLLSLAAHKIYGPKGVGVLYIKKGIKIHNLIYGGAQEKNRRAGTENVAGAVAMAKALRMTLAKADTGAETMKKIQTLLWNGLTEIEGTQIHTPHEYMAPHIINFSLKGIKSEVFIHALERKGVFVSTTSACSSKKKSPSKTLIEMGVPETLAESAIRISLSFQNSEEEALTALAALKESANQLRKVMK